MIHVENLLIEIQYQLVEATSEPYVIITPHILQGYRLEKDTIQKIFVALDL